MKRRELITILQATLDRQAMTIATLLGQIEKAGDRIAKMSGPVGETSDPDYVRLRKSYDALGKSYEAVAQQNVALRKERDELQGQLTELERDTDKQKTIADLNQEVLLWKERHDRAANDRDKNAASSKNAIDIRDKQLAEARALQEMHTKERNQLATELQEATTSAEENFDKFQKATVRADVLTGQVEKLTGRVQVLKSRSDRLKRDNTKLEKQVGSLDERLHDRETRLGDALDRIQELEAVMRAHTGSELSQVIDQRERYKEAVKELQRQLAHNESIIRDLRAQLDERAKNTDDLQSPAEPDAAAESPAPKSPNPGIEKRPKKRIFIEPKTNNSSTN